MNNNQYRRQEFNRRRIYKGATTYCQSYECPIFQNLLLENQQLKEKNELEFNDFIKFRKEQEDRHLEEKDKLIKENCHLRKQLQQRDEVIEECIESIQNFMTHIDDGFCADMMTFIDILNKYKGDKE